MITTILKSFDTFVIIATTSSSITLSVTGFGLIAISTSSGIACGLTIKNKVIYMIDLCKSKINTKKKNRNTNIQLNLLIIYITKAYKII